MTSFYLPHLASTSVCMWCIVMIATVLLSLPFVFVSRPSMDEAEKYQQRLQAIVVRTSLFFSAFMFALLPTTSVCLKPT